MERLNGISRISPQDCGQLNGQGSCEGCPVYTTARDILAENGGDALVLQTTKLTSQCPAGAEMDVASLGIEVSPISNAVLENRATWTVPVYRKPDSPYFVR